MNIFEINIKRKYILIANEQRVQLIHFDKLNLAFDKPRLFLECNDIINQIKLMKTDKDEDILLVLENSGLLYAKKVLVANKIIEDTPIKIFNCKVNSEDNSIWSIDFFYPYIVIGGNHRCVMAFDYNDELTSIDQSNCILYEGNDHNIPSVSISQCGLFLCSNSIDGHVKVFDFYKGTLLIKILNPKNDWGWGVNLIEKSLFDHIEFDSNTLAHQNNANPIINMLGLANLTKTNKDKLSQGSIIDEVGMSPYELFLQYNLVNKYYLLSSSQERLSLYEMCFENNILVSKPIGKIELLVNQIKEKYKDIVNLDVYSVFMIKNMLKYSRYEFIQIAYRMKVMIIGNKNGDLQIYPLTIDIDMINNKIGIRDKPIIILDCNERIAGIRLDEKGDTILDIYVLTLSGMFYCYQITKTDL